MGTETMEVEANGEADILPMGGSHAVEVGGDIEAAVADAEAEGMVGVPAPVPGDPEAPAVADAMADAATKEALAHLYDVQDRLDEAISDHEAKADRAKTAKKRVESLQDDLSLAVKKLRDAKTATEPDPKRYPLYDRAKAEIDATFAKPDSIPPLPADTEEEFFRRKRRDTRLDSLGLTPKITEILGQAGYHTVGDLDKLWEANAPLTTIRVDAGSITESRAEKVRDVISEAAEAWVAEWKSLHPEAPDSIGDEDDTDQSEAGDE